MDYILKSSDERVVINDFVQGDPLSEENLDRTLELVSNLRKVDSANPCKMGVPDVENPNEIRLLFPNKTIWLYTGFRYEDCLIKPKMCEENIFRALRYEILKNVDVMVDGRYIDAQRNPSKKWAGSDNQRVINCQKSLQQGEIVLWTN